MKKSILALSLCAIGLASAHAAGATAVKCEAPVLQVPSATDGNAQYAVVCSLQPEHLFFSPEIRFTGEIDPRGSAPYGVSATYSINAQSWAKRKVGETPYADQVAVGSLKARTVSVGTLPHQFAAQMFWDDRSHALSIEEGVGSWHVFQFSQNDANQTSITDSGYASAPVKDGAGRVFVKLDGKVSRFAGKGNFPIMQAELRLREGKLEVSYGETQAANQEAVQSAVVMLDRKPSDMSRAWALAARAQFLNLPDEIRYAEQKVAAHNPDLLQEFQESVQRIKPYTLR